MSAEIFHVKLGLNSCYLIRGKSIVMVDGGMPYKLEKFKNELVKLGIKPAEIRLIVLTHSHFDHCGSAKEIRDLTGARIAVHKSEKKYLENGAMEIPRGVTLLGKLSRPLVSLIAKRMSPTFFKPDILIGEKEHTLLPYGIDGKIIHTPGHTEGSISVILNSGEAFVGCMAHNGFPFRLRPGLPIYAADIGLVKKGWKTLIDRGVRYVYPGHGNPFPVEIMKRSLKL